MWAGCPCALCYVAVLPITLYQSDPAYHYLVVCSVVRGLRKIYTKRRQYFKTFQGAVDGKGTESSCKFIGTKMDYRQGVVLQL